MAKQMKGLDVAKNVTKKTLVASVGGIAGYTVGHLLHYGLSLGSIGGAVPADIKIYTAFAFAILGALF